jgi:hypothetical protein
MRPRRNPEGHIPPKTWLKLVGALQDARAAGNQWVAAGKPRPSPLYDTFNRADRELLRMEEEARWPYNGSPEQRKEWSYWQRHYDTKENPARGARVSNPGAWVDGDTTSVMSQGHHGRILVTNVKRYVDRWVVEPKKGWYAIYVHDEPAAGGGKQPTTLGNAGPYTTRGAAKAAGTRRWKTWGSASPLRNPRAAGKRPGDPFAAVRRAAAKEAQRFVVEGPAPTSKRYGSSWGKVIDSAYKVYEKHRIESGVLLPVDDVVAEIRAIRERAESDRRAKNEKESLEAEREYRYQQFQKDRASPYRNPKTARWQDMQVSPDYYVGGDGSSWNVFNGGVPISVHRTRADAEAHFRRVFPAQTLHVYSNGRWLTGQPAGVNTWQQVDAAKKRQAKNPGKVFRVRAMVPGAASCIVSTHATRQRANAAARKHKKGHPHLRVYVAESAA